MITAKDVPADLTLDIGGNLSPEDFIYLVKNFFGYVKELSGDVDGAESKIAWSVTVKEGSNLVSLIPEAGFPQSTINSAYKKMAMGLSTGSLGDIEISERAEECLRSLSEASERIKGIGYLNVWILREPSRIDERLSTVLRDRIDKYYVDYGSIEGKLESIQDVNGSIRVRIRDVLYGAPVNCLIDERDIEKVFSSFRRRVELEGEIKYRRNGTPVSILVKSFEILPDDADLPSAHDVRGLFA